jgi:hypothetical protein
MEKERLFLVVMLALFFGFAMFAPLFIHGAGGDLFGAIFGRSRSSYESRICSYWRSRLLPSFTPLGIMDLLQGVMDSRFSRCPVRAPARTNGLRSIIWANPPPLARPSVWPIR